MDCNKLREDWESEERFAFSGWDFSHIDGRFNMEELPWDYKKIIKRYLQSTDKLLDIGTGGGEFLLSLNHPNEFITVTEEYPPNVRLCKERLSPLGITVVQTYNDVLPFSDETFDIIINRQASFDLEEINRVLKPGGYFITQQVGNTNNNDLSEKLIGFFESKNSEHTLKRYLSILNKLRYSIIKADEAFPVERFFSVGALVYYAKIIEWEFPGFTVNSQFNRLCDCQRELEECGFVRGTAHRFIMVTKKPRY